ncbi:MAG: hypothetical protein HC825_11515 [Oscillatoriales cyanobacterium RM1_1_9]|nr:hypothetical protein [Oscillatoriales cyanobacterium RM1_1_9]
MSAATLVGGIAGGAILAGLGSDRRDPPPQPEEFPEAEPEVAGDSASLQGTFIQETLTQASDQNISSNQEDTLIVDGVPEVETLRPEAVAPESPRIVAPDLDTYLTSDAQVTSKTISEAIIIPGETIPEETIVISEISETLPGEVIAEVTIIEQTTIEDTLLTTDLIASEVNVYETTPEPLILEVAEAPRFTSTRHSSP